MPGARTKFLGNPPSCVGWLNADMVAYRHPRTGQSVDGEGRKNDLTDLPVF
jgi:hypothetical protein